MVVEKSNKKIWYISRYVAPPNYDTHGRAIKFTEYLSRLGYDVTIFTSSYLHYKNINLIQNNEKYLKKVYNNIKYIHIKTKSYKSNGIIRIYSLLQFTIRLFFLRKKFEKPDIIIHTSQVPFENLTYFIAKSLKAKYIVEVLDLYPESFVAYGLLSKKNPLIKFAYKTEKWLYEKADQVVFSMEGGKDYIIEKGWNIEKGGLIHLDKIHYINNGIDLSEFDSNKEKYTIEDPDLENINTFKVIYIGSIRLANNLQQLIEAAALLKNIKNLRFLVYGDGTERQKLQDFCEVNKIDNVSFKQKWIEFKYIPYLLSKSSLNILNYMPTHILKYGGSQGKLFQYLASGKPICSNPKMGYCPIEKNNLGIAKTFNSAQEYADAILSIVKMNFDLYSQMCLRVRETAKNYDYKVLSEKLVKLL